MLQVPKKTYREEVAAEVQTSRAKEEVAEGEEVGLDHLELVLFSKMKMVENGSYY